MSGKSSATGARISAPKGGGALSGIGESFSPDLFTGTGNFTVPIMVPPGRNGFQPQLSLTYSTGNGNGPFGLGFALGVPGVARKTSRGIPVYDDARDVFLLSGAEDLVPVEQSDGSVDYHPRTEGLFARISHRMGPDDDSWVVETRDGLVSTYGTPGKRGNDPAVLADPRAEDQRRVFEWMLTRTMDTFGNRIEYEYEIEEGSSGQRCFSQIYLREIRYVDHGDLSAPEFLVRVRFLYEERPDPFSERRAGFEIRTQKRCRCIVVCTGSKAPTPIRTVHLEYLDGEGLDADGLARNGVSLLRRVCVEGHGEPGTKPERLPPLELEYTRFEPSLRSLVPITGAELPAESLAHPDYDLVDLFGNGLPDILQWNALGARYWRNLGGGRFDVPRVMKDAPSGLSLGDPAAQILDANGDGRADLMVVSREVAGYFPMRFGGLWDRRSFRPYRSAPSFDLRDPEVRLVDLDGDGVTDAIRAGARLECFFNDPEIGWARTVRTARRTVPASFSDPRVKWADMSGDGLTDIVLVHDGHVEYWPNLGHGEFGPSVSMQNGPRFPADYDPRRILVGDVDGDGTADVVYVDHGKVIVWINQSGNGFSDPIVIHGTPPVTDLDAIRLVDLLGTGVAGVLWSGEAGAGRPRMFFLDFTGGVKPYLLHRMDNDLGVVTRIDYAPSTRFYLEDEQRHETRWKTPLPFPVHVVARVEAIDAISGGKLTTEYRYRHGYWDGVDREFRGFGRVDQRDTPTFEVYHAGGDRPFASVSREAFSPPTETRTWFHLGAVGDDEEWGEADFGAEYWTGDAPRLSRPLPEARGAVRALRGRVLRSELYGLDGDERQERPFTVTESTYAVRGEKDDPFFFPYTVAERVTQWERGEEPLTRFTFTDDYDDHGQPRSALSVAVPRGRDPRLPAEAETPYLATLAVTRFAAPEAGGRCILDRPASATTYAIVNDGSSTVDDLHRAVLAGEARREVIGQTIHSYDGEAFVGLPPGKVGRHGALVRTEGLVVTKAILDEVHRDKGVPPYLSTDGSVAWGAEYPADFRALPALAGHSYVKADADEGRVEGYFAAMERRRYDFQRPPGAPRPPGGVRGLVEVQRDAMGHDTVVEYDDVRLLPEQVASTPSLVVRAKHDYRVLAPSRITDPNGNHSEYHYTPLGLLASIAVMDHAGKGDLPTQPSTSFEYDLTAYRVRHEPISVRTIRRVHHAGEPDVLEAERRETVESVEYSDGFGRVIQVRALADDVAFGDPLFGNDVLPAAMDGDARGDVVGRPRAAGAPPRVLVSGAEIRDNKGRVVQKYEPSFSEGWAYEPPGAEPRGRKATIHYDALGRARRTVNPDRSEQRVIHGRPIDLERPDDFTPTPWEVFTYDANDNAGRTHPDASKGYEHHHDTPASAVIDALGRTAESVLRNGRGPKDQLVTRTDYDIRGNVLAVTDAAGRVAFRYVYDLANRPLRRESIDAGARRVVLDAAGNEVERRDDKGALVLSAYDRLGRPTKRWARDARDEPVTLREVVVHGDETPANGLSHEEAWKRNLLGKPYRHYDEAGEVVFERYAFKGEVEEKVRRIIGDAPLQSVFADLPGGARPGAYRVDWQPRAGGTLEQRARTILDPTEYRTSTRHDALGRVKSLTAPLDREGARKEIRPRYNRAGALEGVTLAGRTYVQRIVHDAKGQRTLVAYGNGVVTRHAYHADSFRLARLRSEGMKTLDPRTYRPGGEVLQDVGYDDDLAGNVVGIRDRTPRCGIPDTALGEDAFNRTFEYDPIYRLLRANGRESAEPPPDRPWGDAPRGHDPTKTRAYAEDYHYDEIGNLVSIGHDGEGRHVRVLDIVPLTNRLATMTIGQTVYRYAYDACGNLVREDSSRRFEWDHADRMRAFAIEDGGGTSVYVQYLYDAGGQRVKKWVRKGNGAGALVETTISVDGVFERQTARGQASDTLHVMDGRQRIALVRAGPPLPDDRTPAVKYQLGDHLGSASVVVDDRREWVNREEHTPYGETSFGSFAKKRYRFTGKERDEESGLYFYGGRYYSPWTGRFVSVDRLPDDAGHAENPYTYVHGNPLSRVDPSGWEDEPAQKDAQSDYVRFSRIQTPVLPFLFGPAHVRPYMREQETNIGNPVLKMQAHIGQMGSLAAAKMTHNLMLAAGGMYVGGMLGVYGAAAAPAASAAAWPAITSAGAKAGAAFTVLGIRMVTTWPRLTQFIADFAAGVQDMTVPRFAPAVAGVGRAIHVAEEGGLGRLWTFFAKAVKQEHHWLTNKSIKSGITKFFSDVVAPYGLKLEGKWNQELLEHLGRHPSELWHWIAGRLMDITSKARGSQSKFLNLLETEVKQVIRENVDMLKKKFWTTK